MGVLYPIGQLTLVYFILGQFSLALFVLGLLCVEQDKNRLSNFAPRQNSPIVFYPRTFIVCKILSHRTNFVCRILS